MIWAADAGNSSFRLAPVKKNYHIKNADVISFEHRSDVRHTLKNLFTGKRLQPGDSILLSAVTAEKFQNRLLDDLSKKHVSVCVLTVQDAEKIIKVNYKTKKTLGCDRVFAAAAAAHFAGSNVISALFGTATVIDVVKNGVYSGGVIMPGIRTSWQGLKMQAPALPEPDFKKYSLQPGKTSLESVSRGVLRLSAAAFAKIIEENCREIFKHPVPAVACGGAYKLIKKQFPEVHHRPYLVLEGIILLAQKYGL